MAVDPTDDGRLIGVGMYPTLARAKKRIKIKSLTTQASRYEVKLQTDSILTI
jgi:hypothetical protein